MLSKEKRLSLAINLGIVVLSLTILLLVREIFGRAIGLIMTAFIAILLPFSIALFLSYLIAPIFKLLEKHLRQRNRLINIVIVFAAMLVLLVLFGRFAGLLIYEQGIAFIENDWPRVVDYFDNLFTEDAPFASIYRWIVANVRISETEKISLNLIAIFQSITLVIITIVLVPVFLFFLLHDRKRIFTSLIIFIPKKWRLHTIELTKRANRVVEEYFNGRFITMFVMAIAFTIVFFILGFRERSVLFGFMLGFFDIVPYVGPFIAIILPVLYSLTETETLMFGSYAPLAILVINIIGQMIQNNVAQPLIMGRETKIHPLLVLSAFVFFGYLFGVVGLILAIPITGTIKTTFLYIREQYDDKVQLDEKEKSKIEEASI